MVARSMAMLAILLFGATLSVAADAKAPASARARPAAECAAHMKVELDRDSFRSPGLTSARLETFRRAAGERFKSAAGALCAAGKLNPGRMKPLRRLLVQSGSGAVNTAIYTDPDFQGPATLIFQWVFDEENLGLPEKEDVAEGLQCWADPEFGTCEERAP